MDRIRYEALEANRRIGAEKLAALTWGNASAYDPVSRLMAIKPSGVPYQELVIDHIVVVHVDTLQKVAGELNPSSDLITHARLYQAWPDVRGIVHTHSPRATAWAQSVRDLPCLGTTHADHFAADVPCTRTLNEHEVSSDYTGYTAQVIIEAFASRGLNPLSVPAVLVAHHAPFTWGESASKAVDNAVALEACAGMLTDVLSIRGDLPEIPEFLLRFHFERKHGPNATYGQKA
jgi:L-ribulose-5-phosphate 4-epimerase